MLIRHPTSGLFWSVNDACEVSLATEGSVYVKSTCDVPPHLFHFDDNTSHLKNTVTGKCLCRQGDKLVEAGHGGIHNGLFEWTIVDGMIQSYQGSYVDGDLSLVDKTEVQWGVADSFDDEEAPVVAEEAPVVAEEAVSDEEVPALVTDDEEDVPVNRASALIEEALNAQAEPEVTPEIEQVIAETVADVLTAPVVEEASTDEVEA